MIEFILFVILFILLSRSSLLALPLPYKEFMTTVSFFVFLLCSEGNSDFSGSTKSSGLYSSGILLLELETDWLSISFLLKFSLFSDLLELYNSEFLECFCWLIT